MYVVGNVCRHISAGDDMYLLFYFLQGLKLTLVRWPMAHGFPVGPVESILH